MSLKLGEMLISEGVVSREQLEEALKCHVIFGIKLGSSLIELGYVDEDTLVRLLSEKMGIPAVHSGDLLDIPEKVVHVISAPVAEKYRIVPIKLDSRRLAIAMSDPTDFKTIDELSFITGYTIQPHIAPDVQIVFALERYYNIKRDHRYLRVSGELQKGKWLRGNQPDQVENEELLNLQIPRELNLAPAKIEESRDNKVQAGGLETYTIDKLSKDFARARHRDDVADTYIKYLGQEFIQGALFIVRGNSMVGWRAVASGRRLKDFESVTLELTGSTEFSNVLKEPHYYQGLLNKNTTNCSLIESLGLAPSSVVLALPLSMLNRVVAITVVSSGSVLPKERINELQRLVKKASLAFEILILRDRLLQT